MGWMRLRTADRRAYLARGRGPSGVVVFHPWWGLNSDVLDYAERLATEGFVVVAPDLYGDERTAKTVRAAEELVDNLDEHAADRAAAASVDVAVALSRSGMVCTLGFSLGGVWALSTTNQRPHVRGSVVYYATAEGAELRGSKSPVLGHFADEDPYESDENVAAFRASLTAAGRRVRFHHYPGTSHWFAEPSQPAHDPAAAAVAFARSVEFLGRVTTGRSNGAGAVRAR